MFEDNGALTERAVQRPMLDSIFPTLFCCRWKNADKSSLPYTVRVNVASVRVKVAYGLRAELQ